MRIICFIKELIFFPQKQSNYRLYKYVRKSEETRIR